MASTIFTNGKLNEVFFRFGVWGNINNAHKFLHAPFDRVELNGDVYLNTRSIGAANGSAALIPHIATVNAEMDEIDISDRDMFFTELNPITMEEHQMGNWAERGEDWVGVHRLGYI